jgi:hypothetical protein
MTDRDIESAVLTDPMELKRLSLSDGKEYEVRAGKIAIGKRVSTVVVNGLIHTISNMHITRIVPVAAGDAT